MERTLKWSPLGIDVRAGDEALVARGYVVHCQGAHAVDAEVFANERAEDVAVYDAAFDVIDGVVAVGLWLDS